MKVFPGAQQICRIIILADIVITMMQIYELQVDALRFEMYHWMIDLF